MPSMSAPENRETAVGTKLDHSRERARLPLRKKLIFACLPAFCLLGVIETIARTIPRETQRFQQMRDVVVWLGTGHDEEIIAPDRELFWKLRPEVTVADDASPLWRGQLTNSQSLRNETLITKKSANVFRVVCLGDSTTFGLGSVLRESWPAIIEQRLRSQHPNRIIQVINAGIPGYTSYQGLTRLKRQIDAWKPDLVIATFGTNDCWHWNNQTDREHAEELARGRWLRPIQRYIRSIGLLERAFSPRLRSDQGPEWASHTVRNFITPPPDSWTARVPVDEFRENLRELDALCRQHDSRLILVSWPDRQLIAGQPSVRLPYVAAVHQVCRERQIPLCDVLSAFESHWPQSLELFLDNDLVHVSPDGNRLASDCIVRQIPASWIDNRPADIGHSRLGN